MTEAYIVDARDWPFRWVAVVRTPHYDHQRSCVTFWGARLWMARTERRIARGLA